MSRLLLGLDLGGTKIAVGVVSTGPEGAPRVQDGPGGVVLARRRAPTAELGDGEPLLARIAAMAEEVCAEVEVLPGEVDGVGLGLPGPVDPETQALLAASTLPGLIGYPVTSFFARCWGQDRPGWVRADNDANLAALAEAQYGAGQGARVVVYFTVSTGIGGGVVVDGRPFRGATGQAGEFGHLKLRAAGPPCLCGDRGCLEALASGPAIARRALEAAQQAAPTLPPWADAPPEGITAERVAEAARAGCPLAQRVWEAAMADLGTGVATVVNLFNPDRVVMGGGVCRSADLLLPPVRRVVAARAMPMLARAVRIEAAALGDDVGIIGAAAQHDSSAI